MPRRAKRYLPWVLGIVAGTPACVFWDMGSWSNGSNGYSKVVLADEPLAYWPLDDAAGSTVVVDVTAHGHDATVSGDVTLRASGIGAGAALFTNGMLDVDTAFAFAGAAPYTLEAWVKPMVAVGDTRYRAVVSRETNTPTRNGYDIWFQAAPEPRFGFEQTVGGPGTSVVAALPSQDVVHVAAVYDGSSESIYVNGALVQSGPAGAPPSIDAHFLWGASAAFAANFFQGTLDELAVYGRVLDAAQINHHWQAGLAASR